MPLATGKESLASYSRDRSGLLNIAGGLAVPFGRVHFERIAEPLQASTLVYALTQRGHRLIDVRVEVGDEVRAGDVLAANDLFQLRTSRSGRVSEVVRSKRRLKGHIKLEVTDPAPATLTPPGPDAGPAALRQLAVDAGIWAELEGGMQMLPPRLDVDPKAIVVRCIYAEPHVLRGDLVIRPHVDAFVEGLELLGKLGGGYAPVEMTLTAPQGELARQIRQRLRGRAFVHTVDVPVRYPVENPLLLATLLGRDHGHGPGAYWMTEPQEVVALQRAVKNGAFWGERMVAVAGPGVKQPVVVEAPVGMPLAEIVRDHLGETPLEQCALLHGGYYTGRRAEPGDGLEYGDRTILVVPETEIPELFGWLRPGKDRHSWTRMFTSALVKSPTFLPRTLLRSDRRPCVQCGFCRDACPAGLYPHHLHRLVTHDCMDEAEAAGLLNCVECQSCSYGCVSKIELSRDIIAARRQLLEETAG